MGKAAHIINPMPQANSHPSYVLAAATSTFLLGLAHTLNTGAYRKAAKVPYPAAYAPESRTDPEAHRFNCAQRAHANYVENQTQTVLPLLIAGLRFPITAAVMGAVWTLSRYMYLNGYSKGGDGGKGRYKRGGAFFWLPQVAVIGMAGYTGLAMVLGW